MTPSVWAMVGLHPVSDPFSPDSQAALRLAFSTQDLNGPLRMSTLHNLNENILSLMVPDPLVRSDVTLAVEEAVSNIVQHSYVKAEVPVIDFEFVLQKKKLTIHIDDDGVNGYRIQQPPTLPNSSESLKAHVVQHRGSGLGLFMIQKLMDGIAYEVGPSRRNRITLTKKLQTQSAS